MNKLELIQIGILSGKQCPKRLIQEDGDENQSGNNGHLVSISFCL